MNFTKCQTIPLTNGKVVDLIPVVLFSTDLLLRRASEVKACEQYTEAYYLFTYLCLYFVVCFVFYFRLRRENVH